MTNTCSDLYWEVCEETHKLDPQHADAAGHVALCFAVITRAIADVRGLQDLGILSRVGGRCLLTLDEWPHEQADAHIYFRALGDYDRPAKVESLVHFFTSGAFEDWLDLACSVINASAALEALGLAKWQIE